MEIRAAETPFSTNEEGASALAQLETQPADARTWTEAESCESSCPVQWRAWCLPRQHAILHSGSPDTDESSR